jgi:hypothetical protein
VFTVDCRFSHQAPDDPIVHPGAPGASHLHDFFGNTRAYAASTAGSLRGAPTTCTDRGDTSAYWAPAIFAGTSAVRPDFVRAYYRAPIGVDARRVQALPPSMEMIAGDVHQPAGTEPPLDQVAWGCGLTLTHVGHRPGNDCTPDAPLTLRLVFPDCWDGVHLRSADHRSHLARSRDGRCPASHPSPIEQVQLSFVYPVWRPTTAAPSPDATRLTLASGGWQTSHGDLLNAWDQRRLARQTDLCVHAMVDCTIG